LVLTLAKCVFEENETSPMKAKDLSIVIGESYFDPGSLQFWGSGEVFVDQDKLFKILKAKKFT
jgi:hypothetical protein